MIISDAPHDVVLAAHERIGEERRTLFLMRRSGESLPNLVPIFRLGLIQGYLWRGTSL